MKKELLEWLMVVVLTIAGSSYITWWVSEVEAERLKEEHRQDLRYVEVILGQKIRKQEQELAECRRGGSSTAPPTEIRVKTVSCCASNYRPGMADGDGGGN